MHENRNEDLNIDFSEGHPVTEPVMITRQQSSPPPPPKPQVPIPVPNDRIIEEEVLTLQDFDISQYADSLFMGTAKPGSADKVVANPQTSPSILRIVEPGVPDAAQKAGIKAKIWVSFLVKQNGKVEEANISKILLYNKQSGEFMEVSTVNYGLTEAVIDAALQWRFHPATDNGKPVKAYSKQIFTFGF